MNAPTARRARHYGELTIARRHPRLYARLTWASADAVIRAQMRKEAMARLPVDFRLP